MPTTVIKLVETYVHTDKMSQLYTDQRSYIESISGRCQDKIVFNLQSLLYFLW